MKSIYKRAMEKWGLGPQLGMLQEECAELIMAVNKVNRRKTGAWENMIEELADVELMCEQIGTYVGRDKIKAVKAHKLLLVKSMLDSKRAEQGK